MAETLKQEEQDELVINDSNITDEPVEKEYEKLLFKDESRLKAVKAFNLVKMGLFYQSSVEPFKINFNELKKLDYAKRFKEHELYERVSDGTFFFIQTLGESTKEGNNKVYGYDVIELDNVDDETYKKLVEAHKHEENLLVNIAYIGSMVSIALALISFIITVLYNIIEAKSSFFNAVFVGTMGNFSFLAISLAAFVIATIVRKNYNEK
ncbi:MAG: hypothetical protein K6G28_06220 [Acholeplasmatales bacterium]|nr:hypothetical protein [Acholeplasmatales bacterium]